jgi:hypothetical protein
MGRETHSSRKSQLKESIRVRNNSQIVTGR